MKKRYLFTIIISVIGIAGYLWWRSSSSTLKTKIEQLKPEVKVVSVSITDIQGSRIKSTLAIILTNRLPVEINIPKLEYNIFIDSLIVVESLYTKPIHIEPSGNSRIILPMETLSEPMERLLNLFDEQNRDSAVYTFNAAFSVDVPIAGVRDFTIHEEKRMPALRIPKLKVDNVDVDKLGFDESRLNIMVHIANPSLFSLKLKNAGYTFTIDKVLKLEGTLKEIIDVPPRGSQSLPMVLDIKTAKIVRLTWKVLFEKKYTDFKMNFYGTIVSTDNSVNNGTLTIAIDGTLDELRDLKEKK
jgi:LEA14-like dessication related protein